LEFLTHRSDTISVGTTDINRAFSEIVNIERRSIFANFEDAIPGFFDVLEDLAENSVFTIVVRFSLEQNKYFKILTKCYLLNELASLHSIDLDPGSRSALSFFSKD